MIGKTILELDRVDSTNAYANKVFAGTGLDDGTVIWAHEQLAGRGQGDHTWSSEAGKNFTFTVCLKPWFLEPDRQFQLNKAISLGVVDFIRSILQPDSCNVSSAVSVKWPNDIYHGNNKIGGILIENKIMGASLETSFAGIGLNINQTSFAPELPNPVSLAQILKEELHLKDALDSLCGCIDKRYSELRNLTGDRLDAEFNEHILGFGQWRKFSCDGEVMMGKIIGVDQYGRLLVETRSGETRGFSHKEIEYILG
jgi:BirA family biotin operon repressor/biotin-[acetyl-CoA-carboxylase] ligase